MDKKALPFVGIFAGIGVLLIVGAILFGIRQYTFIQKAHQTTGTVIGLVENKSQDSGTTYAPELSYTVNTIEYTFVAGFSTYPPSHAVGDKELIYYDPKFPDQAKLGGFLPVYLVSLIMGGIGLVFVIVGGSMFLVYTKRKKDIGTLLQQGNRVGSTVTRIQQDMAYNMNGKHPYRIYTTITPPGESAPRELHSDILWKNPEPAVQVGGTIDVYIDMGNTKRYYIDTRNLPK
ncbi:MAG: DUF3592 domain-containing protein [Candidatus Magasanikbacteria bacterium]|jgi:hypothetical protein|nr:DUF3592 domain-containing protein [Candidatus Magasanikbacteria bacterium]